MLGLWKLTVHVQTINNTASGAWALVCLFSPLECYKAKTYIKKKKNKIINLMDSVPLVRRSQEVWLTGRI